MQTSPAWLHSLMGCYLPVPQLIKKLPSAEHIIHLTGVVKVDGFGQFMVLQNTRLFCLAVIRRFMYFTSSGDTAFIRWRQSFDLDH